MLEWRIAPGRTLTLDRARVVAILNVTPDSFHDGGRLADPSAAAFAAARARDAGAAMLDVGGESTRPGAGRIDADEQIRRIVPAIRAIRDAGVALPISVDTTIAEVARSALDAGADAVNDVSAGLEDGAMLPLVAERACGVILMHRLAPPPMDRYSTDYRSEPRYPGGVVPDVEAFLAERMGAAERAGIASESIVLDAGLGFGKSVEQNIALVDEMGGMQRRLGRPMLAAASRKSFLGGIGAAKQPPADRLPMTLEVHGWLREQRIMLFRVHDVAEHVRLFATIESAGAAPDRPGA